MTHLHVPYVAALGELTSEPRGTLRLVVSTGAERFLRDELLAEFLTTHPHIQLDIAVTNEIRDIVASGYDAGIHLGEVIDRDMAMLFESHVRDELASGRLVAVLDIRGSRSARGGTRGGRRRLRQ